MTMGEPPERVRADVAAWRESCDLLFGYISEHLALGAGGHVISDELLDAFNGHITGRGHRAWAAETFTARFEVHSAVRDAGVAKIRPRRGQEPELSRPPGGGWRDVPGRYQAWSGVKFKNPEQEETAGGSGWSGPAETPYREASREGFTSTPDHPDQTILKQPDFARLAELADPSLDDGE
jgi:hypothetical protein